MKTNVKKAMLNKYSFIHSYNFNGHLYTPKHIFRVKLFMQISADLSNEKYFRQLSHADT